MEQSDAVLRLGDRVELGPEDDIVRGAREVHEGDIRRLTEIVDRAGHGHQGCDAAPRREEQEPISRMVGHTEIPERPVDAKLEPCREMVVEVVRDQAPRHPLDRDRQAVRTRRG